MKTKILEIRDRMTFIPVLATKMEGEGPSDPASYYLRNSGFPHGKDRVVLVYKLSTGEGQICPNEWGSGSRTMCQAHIYIRDEFDRLNDGDVIDVEFILHETSEKKISERPLKGR